MQIILLWFFLINGLYMFRTFTCPSSGVLIYKVVSLPHVVLCHRCWGCGPAELVCSLVHCLSVSRGHLWEKIIVKLFASSWYIFLTYIYDARSHLHQIKMDLQEVGCGVWTGSSWLKIWKAGGHLWMREWTFGFHKMRGISSLAKYRLASQERLCSME